MKTYSENAERRPMSVAPADTRKRPRGNSRREMAFEDMAVPPHDIQAEQALLAAMMLEADIAIQYASEITSPQAFYRPNHSVIFVAMCGLVRSGSAIDIVTLMDALKSSGDLDAVGGVVYLTALFDTLPSAANHAYYAKIVRDKHTLRRIEEAAHEMRQLAHQQDVPIEEVVTEAEQCVSGLRQAGVRTTGSTIQDTLAKFEANWNVEEGAPSAIMGARSGLVAYDDFTNGLQRNKLIVIPARPAMGKSCMLQALALGSAMSSGRPSLIMSAEMEDDEIWVRIASSMSQVDSRVLESGKMSEEDWAKYEETKHILADTPLYIDTRRRPTPSYIRSVARRCQSLYGDIGFIGVDYLQLMRADRESDNRVQDLGRIAYDLKDIAGEFGVPVVALAQLNRSVESREDKRPVLSDIRASGEIEEAADIICALYREEYYTHKDEKDMDPGRIQEVELLFLKQRKGPTGMVKVGFVGQHTRFLDLPNGGCGMQMWGQLTSSVPTSF